MKNGIKSVLIAALTLAVWGGMLMPVKAAQEVTDRSEEITLEFSEEDLEVLSQTETLFNGYVEQFFYEEIREDAAAFGNIGEKRLKGSEKEFYLEFRSFAEEVAAGMVTDTTTSLNVEFLWSAKDLGASELSKYNYDVYTDIKLDELIGKVFSYILMDCPYEMYWNDKTIGMSMQYRISFVNSKVRIYDIVLKLPVAIEYRGYGGVYSFNTGIMAQVQRAKHNAQAIVWDNEGKTRYEKLTAYKDAICELTSYNYDAFETESFPYGNPWQLIWVFDGNPNTDVVCEGYSKAFQYLCDLSGLACYSVYGIMTNGNQGGPHMWNIVPFNNKNYLVDITNCDDGTVGSPDILFMAANTGGSVSKGYLFTDAKNLLYIYDLELIDLMQQGELAIASKKFDPYAFENVFSDVFAYDWFYPYVEYVYKNNLMSGYQEKFTPNDYLTKAQVAQVLYNMEGQPEITDRSACTELVDVYEDWFTAAVCWAYSNGIITGDLYTKEFSPNANVTREQLALMLFRYSAYKGYDISVRGELDNLQNAWKLSTYAQDAVQWAVGMNLISGIEKTGANGTVVKDLSPQGKATRAQMAAILARFYETY